MPRPDTQVLPMPETAEPKASVPQGDKRTSSPEGGEIRIPIHRMDTEQPPAQVVPVTTHPSEETGYVWTPVLAAIKAAKTPEEAREYLRIHENGRTKKVREALDAALAKL